MIKGLYTSAAGMLPLSFRQDLMTNNLANSSTAGFKRDRLFIHDLITADLYLNEHQFASTGGQPPTISVSPHAFAASAGNSSQVVEEQTDFSQGAMEVTGNDFNLGIDGNGFFTVQTPQGVQYTRNGFLNVGANGSLVTAAGFPVLGTAGPINVQGRKFTVLRNGDVYVDNELRGRLRIIDFPKPYKLTKTANDLFTPQGGAAGQAAQNFRVNQGMLEKANAHPVDQLVQMIELQRLFEIGQRAIRMQDETLQQAISQVGKV